MPRRSLPLCLAAALAVTSAACPSSPGVTFDAERAWKDLLHQVEIGPRPSGTPENETCRAWIEAELKAAGYEPRRESFQAATPAGEIAFANVVAELPGKSPTAGWVALGSHFDTKRLPFRFVGANDGASSTAVLLELARALRRGGPRDVSYRFVFFDGEEAVRPEWAGEDNTYGSRHHVQLLREKKQLEGLRAFVLLDMVGDKDLRLTTEQLSDRRYRELFAAAARRIDLGRHVGGPALEVRDDHVPFLLAGVRCVDLIDFDYGPGNSFWHTEQDVPEHCAQASLDAIGRIVLAGLDDLEQELRR